MHLVLVLSELCPLVLYEGCTDPNFLNQALWVPPFSLRQCSHCVGKRQWHKVPNGEMHIGHQIFVGAFVGDDVPKSLCDGVVCRFLISEAIKQRKAVNNLVQLARG